MRIIESPDEVKEGTVIIRSHGIAPAFMDKLVAKGLKIVDATCPFVKNARNIALMLEEKGFVLVIIGEPNHPEICSLVDSLKGKSWVINHLNEIESIPKQEKIGVIAQTTQYLSRFRDAIDHLLPRARELAVYNTICDATTRRQDATRNLAANVDLMFVVGGKNSANTARLYEISQECGVESYFIETAEEIRTEWLKNKKNIGITAGASTPDWIIDLVYRRIQELSDKLIL